MDERWPWEAEESLQASDPLAHQRHEELLKEKSPRVVKLLPVQGTVMGSSSPHQTGDIVCYDILNRAPVYDLTSHFSDIPPRAPARGAHRHISLNFSPLEKIKAALRGIKVVSANGYAKGEERPYGNRVYNRTNGISATGAAPSDREI